jgi:hypothetical protein
MANISKRTRKLIDASIDGTITARQAARLDEIFAVSAEAVLLHKRLLQLDRQLMSAVQQPESVDVTDKVMQRIASAQKPIRNQRGWIVWPDIQITPVTLHYIMAVFVGLMMGSAFTWIILEQRSQIDHEMLSGTISARATEGFSLQNQNTSLRLIPYNIGETLHLNFLIDTRDEVEVQVSFDELAIHVNRADYLTTQGPQNTNFLPGKMAFSAFGKTSFQLILEKQPLGKEPIFVTVTQNSQVLINKEMYFE